MSEVRLTGLVKRFGDSVTAVDHVTITAEEGKLTTLLGPSGCGKTTTMRMIAGLETPDEGEIWIGDQLVASPSKGVNVPPEKRDVGMVFQSYAVWPHKTVFENIAYPLRIRRRAKAEIKAKVAEALRLLELEGLEKRYPGQLSGGQQQRVALGRAMVYEPRLVLLDEPLANLDAKVRETVRFELKELQRKTNFTMIYVTHDQAEAMVLSDKIVVMDHGRVLQEGRPLDIYFRPATEFVAGFIGQSNFTKATLRSSQGGYGVVDLDGGISLRIALPQPVAEKSEVLLCIRPEDFELLSGAPRSPEDGRNVLEGTIETRAFLGNIVHLWVSCNGWRIRVQADPGFEFQHRDDNGKLYMRIREDRVKVLV